MTAPHGSFDLHRPTARGPRAPISPARLAAHARLLEDLSRYPEIQPSGPGVDSLSDRDAALAHAIHEAAVRRWITIRSLAGRWLRRPWDAMEPPVRAALLAGGAQLLFLDRIPPHAAINESVEWVKQQAGRGAASVVNAVLRRISEAASDNRRETWSNLPDELPLSSGGSRLIPPGLLPDNHLERAAAVTGIPVWQVRRWADQAGAPEAQRWAWHALERPPIIAYTGAAALPLPMPDAWLPHRSPDHAIFQGSRTDLTRIMTDRADLWVQDPGASESLKLAANLTPTLILDLCAGRGTKTRQLRVLFPNAKILAWDANPDRILDLRSALASLPDVAVPSESELHSLAGRFDLVLADVPCTNTGVLARRIEARHRCAPSQLDRLSLIQQEILRRVRDLARPAGHILYSTCSLDRAENQAMEDWALSELALRPIASRSYSPRGGPGLPPSEHADASFASLLETPGAR